MHHKEVTPFFKLFQREIICVVKNYMSQQDISEIFTLTRHPSGTGGLV